MLRIRRSANGEVVFTLSGQIDEEATAALEKLIKSEGTAYRIVLDMRDLTLVNEDAIKFFERCEADSITLRNCPAYVRSWINGRKRES
jgi:anti-anti-sigma regulatory factor